MLVDGARAEVDANLCTVCASLSISRGLCIFRLTFGSKLVLHLPKLFEEIKDARVKRLETKVVLVLLKENPDISWNRLA